MAINWKAFVIDGEHYLAVANYQDNNNNVLVNSVVYKYSTTAGQFAAFQSIPTANARDWEYFSPPGQPGEHYLVVSNFYNGASYELDSIVYHYNPTMAQFEEFQRIPTNRAGSSTAFVMDDCTLHLAIVSWQQGLQSPIYTWNGACFI